MPPEGDVGKIKIYRTGGGKDPKAWDPKKLFGGALARPMGYKLRSFQLEQRRT